MKNISFKLILFIAFLFLGIEAQAQSYFYVDIDAPAGGNGLSWSSAYNNLQDGIDDAAATFSSNGVAGIVRVSDGMYPTPASGFQLKNGVQIWGGYNVRTNSSGSILPDWLINATRFFNETTTTIEHRQNVGIEVDENLGNQTILNGLFFRGENGNATNGIIINSALSFNAKIINCSFYNSRIVSGGALTRFTSTIVGSSFTTSATIDTGIHVYVISPDDLDLNISQTTFKNSSIRCYSNSIQNKVSNIVIDRCKFMHSSITANHNSHVEASNSIFSTLHPPSNYPFLQFHIYGASELVATNCTFSSSEMFLSMNEQTYENCIFYNIGYPSVNRYMAGGIYNFKNCLFNTSINTTSLINPQTTVSFTNTIVANPQFVSTNPNSTDFLKLSNNSPARNAGGNSFIPVSMTRGLGGNSRILERTVDIGAYEFCPSLGACRTTTTPQGGGHTPSRKMTAAIQNSEINSIVYPNPATNVLNIKSKSEIISISLLNVQGQEVKKWNTKTELYIGDLPVGMYLLKVNTKEGTEHIRIIKE
ncbi:T9SS type A sorting domain-containing protein [Bernardetia sp. OM2101]|uniref:T9SS type A sorting domain-containing protein n=1 Tax=Bernardetia sp. OM2101 TaxID=3344876 RepID=UPI0035D111C7